MLGSKSKNVILRDGYFRFSLKDQTQYLFIQGYHDVFFLFGLYPENWLCLNCKLTFTAV